MRTFQDELREHPEAISRLLDNFDFSVAERIRNFKRVVVSGMGSSYFAGHYAASLASDAGEPLILPFQSDYLIENSGMIDALKGDDTLWVLISQSGRSGEVLQLAEYLDEFWAITNNPDSPLAGRAKEVITLEAGEEERSASKTFVNTLLVWHLIFLGKDGVISLAEVIERFMNSPLYVDSLLESFSGKNFVMWVGDGPFYSIALQASLLSKEVALLPSEAHTLGSFKHGPQEIVQREDVLVVFLDPSQEAKNHLAKLSSFKASFLVMSATEAVSYQAGVFHLVVEIELALDRFATSQGLESGSFVVGKKVTES